MGLRLAQCKFVDNNDFHVISGTTLLRLLSKGYKTSMCTKEIGIKSVHGLTIIGKIDVKDNCR